MAELEAAQRHLTEALRRLESALARRLSATGPAGAVDPGGVEVQNLLAERNALADDVDALRRECERLYGAIDLAERERETARTAAHAVAQRLDGSIAELDRLLEG